MPQAPVAVAIRNRWRVNGCRPSCRTLPQEHLILARGVSKTEIARRLALISALPQNQATKYTEGRLLADVESMIRDLTEIAIGMVRQNNAAGRTKAKERVSERLLDLLLPSSASRIRIGRTRNATNAPA